METYSIDTNRLVGDIKGLVAKLKAIYFENKEPIDDNEIVLQKLCVKLETALRHGMKDKYSFMGVQKDYWNFFSECLPKDEGVRYVNSLSQLHTPQGKGRALVRYCLVQKTLADTIQRTLMHKKKVEWFSPDALLLNLAVSSDFISKLYDLNELEFHLSCTGCDLDMSWPSFGRSLTDGGDRRKRRNSGSSVASTTDFVNERVDPLIALNAELSALKLMIAKEFDKDERTGESSESTDDVMQLNVGDVTLELSRVHQLLLKWKVHEDTRMCKADGEIQRLLQKNDRVSEDLKSKLLLVTEKYDNLSHLASKESALQTTDLQNKLTIAEDRTAKQKDELNSANTKLIDVTSNYEQSLNNVASMSEKVALSEAKLEKCKRETCDLREKLEIERNEQLSVKEHCNTLELEMGESQATIVSLRKELEESETKLRIKTLEQTKLQEAFENVNGLVFSSFDDFESYYKAQLQDKERGLEVKDSENKSLERRIYTLTDENRQTTENLEKARQQLSLLQCELEINVSKQREQREHLNSLELQFEDSQQLFERTDKILSEFCALESQDTAENENVQNETFGENSIDHKCRLLINELNKAKEQLDTHHENLKKALSEKTAAESSLERLYKENQDLENERKALLLSRDEHQRLRDELENRILLMKDEKAKVEETLSSVMGEKLKFECKLKEVNETLQEESYSKLVNENELSETCEELEKEKDEKAELLVQVDKLNSQIVDKSEELNATMAELVKHKDELSALKTSFSSTTKDLETANETVESIIAGKLECEEQVDVYKDKLASLQCTMDQEVSSLKFQLSSEVLKYDGEIKELSKERDEAMALREKIHENEETIMELENKLKERNESWHTEKKKLNSDIKHLKHEIKVLNENNDTDKKEIQSMESTLLLSKKKYEKKKERNEQYKRTIKELSEQKSEKENILEQEKIELEEDIAQLKSKLVSVLSDKSELWKRSNQLEFDMKTRLSDTWVEDRNVQQCPKCGVVFSLFVRKHHCRFCGDVFCHACSDNFVKTIHSRKPYRSCDGCYEKEKELRSDTSAILNNSQAQEQSHHNASISSYGSDSETDSSFGQSFTPSLSPTKKVAVNELEKESDDVAAARAQSDDSIDDNFEVIERTECSFEVLFTDGLNIEADVVAHNESWNGTEIPAGKRCLLNTSISAGSHLAIEFTTSPKSVLFGVAFRAKEALEAKVIIPICQVNSHQQNVTKLLEMTDTAGIVTFIFDNTQSKSTTNNLNFKIYLQ